MRLIIFEGISGSGKTTLYEECRKFLGERHLMVQRWTATQFVYDRLYHRNRVDAQALVNVERQLMPILRPLVVWTVCNPSLAEQRKTAAGDDNVEPDLDGAQRLYWKWITGISPLQWVRVRTDEMTVAECGWEVLKAFKCDNPLEA